MEGLIAIAISLVVLALAGAMRIITQTAEENTSFWLCVSVFLVIYIVAVVVISWLNQSLPPANLSSLFTPSTTAEAFLISP